jgi:hypothetical protein
MRLIRQKKVWVLTVWGWLVSLICLISFFTFMLASIHPFLAYSAPIQADVLVVEGWIHDYAIKEAIAEFERGNYQKIITTGLPLPRGYYLSDYRNFAELTAATLVALDVEPDKVIAVPAPDVSQNRTIASAVALRQWLEDSDLSIDSINLLSFDVHSRRSWLIFKNVLAPDVAVGAIAVPSRYYNPKRWWTSSEGVRSILSEAIAYFYVRFVNWQG